MAAGSAPGPLPGAPSPPSRGAAEATFGAGDRDGDGVIGCCRVAHAAPRPAGSPADWVKTNASDLARAKDHRGAPDATGVGAIGALCSASNPAHRFQGTFGEVCRVGPPPRSLCGAGLSST